MATNNGGETLFVHTLEWKIVNLSQCWWLKEKDRIESPKFIVDELDNSKWSLWLYPMDDQLNVQLHREADCEGPECMEVQYHLAFLDKDCSILDEDTDADSFEKDYTSGSLYLRPPEIILVSEREKYLHEDTLTVLCSLWKALEEKGGDDLKNPKLLLARTVIDVNRKYFDWRIDKFSSRESRLRKKFKRGLIEFDFILNDYGKDININITSFHDCVKYISCNTSIRDSEGKKKSCGFDSYLIDDDFIKEMLLSTVVTLPTMSIENRDRYLQNDVLSLGFDIVISTVEHSFCRKQFAESVGQKKSENTSALVEDFKSMFNERILCDFELRTQTKFFPAHKNILSARSTVFRNMFSHNMKEMNSGHVEIIDLEDNTIDRMLLYMYTGLIENLQFESASKLFTAADKYDISSLKSECASSLIDNLCPNTACDVLVLAEQHQDGRLKNAVLHYILNHNEVFRSLEWKYFMDANIKLAADIMYMKVKPDNF